MKITTTDKIPNWFKIILLVMIVALIGCIYYIKNTNIDAKIVSKTIQKKGIETKIDSTSKVRTASIDKIVQFSQNNSNKATKIIKNLPHEKSLPIDTTDAIMLQYIANYQYTEY